MRSDSASGALKRHTSFRPPAASRLTRHVTRCSAKQPRASCAIASTYSREIGFSKVRSRKSSGMGSPLAVRELCHLNLRPGRDAARREPRGLVEMAFGSGVLVDRATAAREYDVCEAELGGAVEHLR